MIKIESGTDKNNLKTLLTAEAKKVTINDLYDLSHYFLEENKYLPREYKNQHIKTVQNIIISRYKQLINDKNIYHGRITAEDAENINRLLDTSHDKTIHLLHVIAVYTTYLLEKPIHLPGTVFPGQKSIFTDGVDYYCPIKKHHLNNEHALCRICIAKIIEE